MVREEKLKEVEELKNLIDSYPVVGIVDVFKLPSRPFQEIRNRLKDKAIIKVIKKSILLHAIRNSGRENVSQLEQLIPLQPAVIFSNVEWFKLYSEVSKLKPLIFAKEGDVVDENIVIKAGPTELSPGPVISEFAKVKIPVGTEGGKIAIKKDTLVTKKGDKLSKGLAAILRKLKIKPIKIALNIVAIFDSGKIYGKDVLQLIGEKYLNMIKEDFMKALNISIAIGYPTRENVGYLLNKAYQNAKILESRIGGEK
jgi:large subunit ribosomal protein L10